MSRHLLLIIVCSLALTGCFKTTTQSAHSFNQLQIRMIDFEKKLDEKDREIVDLQYQLKDLASRVGHESAVSGSEDFYAESEEVAMEDESSEMPRKVAKPVAKKVKTQGEADAGYIVRVNADHRQIQKALQAAGFYQGKIDGKIGSGSKKAIVEFQKAHDLVADGIIGKKTWTELELYLD